VFTHHKSSVLAARGMVTHTGFGVLLGEVRKVPSVTPRFVAFVSLILKLRLSLPSLPRAMRNLNKTAWGLCSTPSSWAFRQELPGRTYRVLNLAQKPPAR